MLKVFFKLLRHDLLSGFSQNKYKYCLVALVVFVLCVSFYMSTQHVWITDELGNLSKFSGATSISDYFIFMSQGVGVGEPISKFPMSWAIIQIVIAFMVATYPTNDLHGYARNIFLRTSNKTIWWYAKVSWTVLTVLSFYLLGFIIVIAFALIVGDSSMFPSSDVSLLVSGIDACSLFAPDLFLALSVGVFASILMSVAQVVLSFLIRPVLSFAFIVACIIAGIFIHAPVLVADYSMLLRNGSIIGDGLCSTVMLLICAIAAIVFSALGGVFFEKRDIL